MVAGILKFTSMVVTYIAHILICVSTYLNFEVYMKFITIYGNIFGYIQCALLLV